MTPEGYEPENNDFWEQLTEPGEDGERVGRDPLTLPLDLLIAAGHPDRRTRSILAVLEDELMVEGMKHKTQLRQQCHECVENTAEIRRCAVIDCPIWPYRMGHNPHSARRGKKVAHFHGA